MADLTVDGKGSCWVVLMEMKKVGMSVVLLVVLLVVVLAGD